MRQLAPALALALAAGCSLGGGGAGADAETGIRQVGGTTLVSDTEGATLMIDENGCQSVMAEGARVAEPVRDADGNPVCVGAGG